MRLTFLGTRGNIDANTRLTYAHPDHAGGLKAGVPCRVFATARTWQAIGSFAIDGRAIITPRKPSKVEGIEVEAFAVEHSIRAPAVGYRLGSHDVRLFYVPDVVSIPERAAALRGCTLCVGDGATLTRPILRRRDGVRIGHTTVAEQLSWCREEGVPQAIFTHCGTRIVTGDERKLGATLRRMGQNVGVEARFAFDGLVLEC